MKTSEPSFSVNVDVTNPGQFFACCGLLELAHRRWPGAEGWFSEGAFHLAFASVSEGDRVDDRFLRLGNSALSAEGIATPARSAKRRGGSAEKIAPIQIGPPIGLYLDWWVSDNRLKLWAGNQSSQDIMEKLRNAVRQSGDNGVSFMDQVVAMKGRFGVDPRAAWKALDVGFSPNEQGMEVATYPAVELLAAVGLQRFRPGPQQNGGFCYATWSISLPAPLAAAACAVTIPAGHVGRYRFQIATRGSYKGFDFASPIGDDT